MGINMKSAILLMKTAILSSKVGEMVRRARQGMISCPLGTKRDKKSSPVSYLILDFSYK